jgi:hypothetical protein
MAQFFWDGKGKGLKYSGKIKTGVGARKILSSG